MENIQRLLSRLFILVISVSFFGQLLYSSTQKVSALVYLNDLEQQINILNGEFYHSYTTPSPTDNSLGLIHFDSSEYTGATVYFEVVIRCSDCLDGNNQVVAQLYNDAGNPITTLTATGNQYQRVRSGSLVLPTDDYTVRTRVDADEGTAYIKAARLIIDQNANPLTETQSQIEIGHYENTSSATATTLSAPKYYLFDADQYDGTVNAYFEATFRTSGNDQQTAYSFTSYDIGGEEWESNPGQMANGTTVNYASTATDGQVQRLTGNAASSTDIGQINSVELITHGYQINGSDGQVTLRPVFSGTTDGTGTYIFTPNEDLGNAAVSSYYDITADPQAPTTWTWSDIDNLDIDVEFNQGASGSNEAFISLVQVRVSYEDNSQVAYVELYNRTDSQVVATLSSSDNDYQRSRSSALSTNWDTTNDDEYEVRHYTSNAANPTYLANAKIIIDQTNLGGLQKTEVIHHMITSARPQTSTIYSQDTFINRYSSANYNSTNSVEVFLEAVMKTSAQTGYVALYNGTDSDLIATPTTSELTTTSTLYERKRTANLAFNDDWPESAKDFTTVTHATSPDTVTTSSSMIIIQARAVEASLSFSIGGVDADTLTNGITSSATSTITTLPFGHLSVATPKYVSHQLNVVTNDASTGYDVYAQLVSPLQGYYPANHIDPFIANSASWGNPQDWVTPDGTTKNVDTGWLGANITDTDIVGWGGNTEGKFAPFGTDSVQIMTSNSGGVDDIEYINYAMEVNVYQPADIYSANLIYNILPQF